MKPDSATTIPIRMIPATISRRTKRNRVAPSRETFAVAVLTARVRNARSTTAASTIATRIAAPAPIQVLSLDVLHGRAA